LQQDSLVFDVSAESVNLTYSIVTTTSDDSALSIALDVGPEGLVAIHPEVLTFTLSFTCSVYKLVNVVLLFTTTPAGSFFVCSAFSLCLLPSHFLFEDGGAPVINIITFQKQCLEASCDQLCHDGSCPVGGSVCECPSGYLTTPYCEIGFGLYPDTVCPGEDFYIW
jgi:hypothetical protein